MFWIRAFQGSNNSQNPSEIQTVIQAVTMKSFHYCTM